MRLLESALYVDDVVRSATFYEDLFGFQRMVTLDRFCALNAGPGQVLLLFLKGGSVDPAFLPDGQMIPPHDGSGSLHFALGIEQGELSRWETRLSEAGIKIESRVKWNLGGESIYFRDPDNHLVEIATRGIWPNY